MAVVPRLRAFLCTDHPDRRKFLSHTLAAATATMPSINLTAAAGMEPAVKSVTDPTKRKFVEEATRLTIESVEKGWGDPFGAVIVKNGEIIGRNQYRVLLTAIMDASAMLSPKALMGSDCGAGTILEMIPREPRSPDPVSERARIDHVYFPASLKDTCQIGSDDAFQYEDFTKPWEQRRIAVTPNFEREVGLKAYEAWVAKK